MQRELKASSIVIILAGIMAVALLGMSWYTVNQGDRALVLRFGRVVSTSGPGIHFKVPFMDKVQKVSVRTCKMAYKMAVYSKDIQSAEIVLSLNYALNPAMVSEIYTKIGIDYEDRVVLPQIMSKAKDVFGQYNAVEIVRSREKLTSAILTGLQEQFTQTGIVIETVQVENIDFSDEYERSVEERMKAEVEVTKVLQNLEREKINADMERTKAQGQADARLAQAKAEAEAIRLVGEAQATAIKVKAEALGQNPNYAKLIQAEKWNGMLPQTMPPNSSLPILEIK